jgi:hypothetical protein
MMGSLGKRNCRTAQPNIQHPSVLSQWNKVKKSTATDDVAARAFHSPLETFSGTDA